MRFRFRATPFLWGLVAAAAAVSVHAARCTASSGPNSTALVELYTSQACTRCRAAEGWLAGLASRADLADKLVPLALHVDYRDYLNGARPQRRLTLRQRLALSFIPVVTLQGADFRPWGTAAFDAAVAQIAGRPARARLSLALRPAENGTFRVAVAAEILDAAQAEDAALYLAAYESRPLHTVLEWHGPIAFPGTQLALERGLPLLPGALAARSGVVGFVQNRRSAEVLQALLLPSCP